ncbi:MAG: DUF5615 family PIN-like protein [Ignavibacteria bacterium]|nr:DUF5615 family PIN-like protein [Ignavibacteria bacterium]
MIIADENIDSSLIFKLRDFGFEVFSIKENLSGESDKNIIQLTKEKKGILITEDKDFGEWVFAHNIKECTIILLRYKNVLEFEIMEDKVVQLLRNLDDAQAHKFITITHNKIRIREI